MAMTWVERVIIWAIALLLGYLAGTVFADDTYRVRLQIIEHSHPDPHGIKYFDLGMPDGRAVLSIDGDLPLAQELSRRRGRQILTLESAALER